MSGTPAAGGAVNPPISPLHRKKKKKQPKHRLTACETLGLRSMPVTHLALEGRKKTKIKTTFNHSCARLMLSECWDVSACRLPHSFVS